MITTEKNGKTFVKCGSCHKFVRPQNGDSDLKLLREGNAEYYCEECSNMISKEDGDGCILCHYEFVKDEIRYTFQMHSTINVKELYKKEEMCVVGNICERCRKLVEKVVVSKPLLNKTPQK